LFAYKSANQQQQSALRLMKVGDQPAAHPEGISGDNHDFCGGKQCILLALFKHFTYCL